LPGAPTAEAVSGPAAAAYIDTCARIYGLDPSAVPTHDAAVALLTGHFAGASPAIGDAITCLEDHYHCGVCWADVTEAPELAEFWRMSAIVSFATSDPAGWAAFCAGDLRLRPPGEAGPGRHVFLVDPFDFGRGCHVATNSWGVNSESAVRFCSSSRRFTRS
jgi:hypothetical protein